MQKFKYIHALILLFVAGCKIQPNIEVRPIAFVDTSKTFRREIPTYDDGRLGLFYLLTKDKQNQLGLDSIENGFINLQIRIWYDSSRTLKRKLVVITNSDTMWNANVYNMKVYWDGETETIISKEVKQVSPKSGWPNFIKRLLDLEVLTLPSMEKISGYETVKDGNGFNFEIATKNQYRFYTYWEPEYFQDKFWQAKKVSEIIALLRTELNIDN